MPGPPAALLLALVAGAAANIIVYTKDFPIIAADFQDQPASFGPRLPDEGLSGLLVAGEPRDACSALTPPPVNASAPPATKWIVLIARYNCSFEQKVRNAQLAGYQCAIVHNVNSSDLETMSAKNAEGIVIPSVFVSDAAGRALAADYLYNSSYYLVVNNALPFDVNTNLLLPFAIVVAICLLVMLIFMIVKCVNDRARARRHRLPGRALRKIPTCKFSKGDPYDTCAICLDDYLDGDRLRVLPCAHAYHAKCIDPWLTQNRRVCPVCKRRVLAAGERRHSSGSDSDDSRAPLVPAPAAPTPATQGGTFEPQRENPFVRAARFMARLRRSRPAADHDDGDTDVQEAPAEDPSIESPNANEENVEEDDRQPLLAAVSTQSERPRRSRRSRRSRLAPASAPSSPPASATPAHSINGEGTATIGVAALPAPAPTPRDAHLQL